MAGDYSYLFVSIIFLIISLVLLYLNKNNSKLVLCYGFMGGIAALIMEQFYLIDYWQPSTIIGIGKVSIEDFIAGFSLSLVAILLYPTIVKKHFRFIKTPNRKFLFTFSSLTIASMLILNLWLKLNSIFVSYLLFAGVSILIVNKRRELLSVVIKSALLFAILSIVIYVPYLYFFSPNFWDKYWLLVDTRWSASIFGLMPITEIFWFLGWGSLGLSAFLYIENLELR